MIHSLAVVHSNAKIAENVTISPFSMIYEDVEIGEGTWIGPNVKVKCWHTDWQTDYMDLVLV